MRNKRLPFPQPRISETEAGKDDSFDILHEWWKCLEQRKGERSSLRRAGTLTAVMLNPGYLYLLSALRDSNYAISNNNHHLSKIACIAGLAARIKKPADTSLATRMGTPGASAPVVSELRLRRILACEDIDDLYVMLRRVIGLLDDEANLSELAATIWHWSSLDRKQPRDPRRRLAYDYYLAAPIKP